MPRRRPNGVLIDQEALALELERAYHLVPGATGGPSEAQGVPMNLFESTGSFVDEEILAPTAKKPSSDDEDYEDEDFEDEDFEGDEEDFDPELDEDDDEFLDDDEEEDE